ncbi:hypothetical protein [Mesobacillus foraminis]|uniref:hypothetical protein n=1 Tax=Mesobacillus foraminis TaxID=279826 RepID=UPI000EF4CED8|nr:hypothetical protein [Mesobacillus foraminis]
MSKNKKKEFIIFPDLHFAITKLIEIIGKEDQEFYNLKGETNSLRTVISGSKEEILVLEKNLSLIKEKEEQKKISLEALSGSLLQILKAKIISRYANHENCPNGRYIYSHFKEETPVSIRDIILSGRIQYNHPEGITDDKARKVFEALDYNYNLHISNKSDESVEEDDNTFRLEEGKILAYDIIVLLEWTKYIGQFEMDMILLFDPEFNQIKRAILNHKDFLFEERKRLLYYLRRFILFQANGGKESSSEVLKAHDSIGVRAQTVLEEIKNTLSQITGGNSEQKKERKYLLKICDLTNNYNPQMFNY